MTACNSLPFYDLHPIHSKAARRWSCHCHSGCWACTGTTRLLVRSSNELFTTYPISARGSHNGLSPHFLKVLCLDSFKCPCFTDSRTHRNGVGSQYQSVRPKKWSYPNSLAHAVRVHWLSSQLVPELACPMPRFHVAFTDLVWQTPTSSNIPAASSLSR